MSDWKADYIRMWQIYFNKPMDTLNVEDVMRGEYVDIILKSYKYGRLLEAIGRLKFPN